jgi:hypothetical protein
LAVQTARRIATLLLCAAAEQLMVRRADETKPYPADKARGGEIMLRSRSQQLIFLAGLVGAVILVLVLGFLR